VSSAAFSELTLEVRHLRQELEALKEKVNATNASLDQLSVSQRLHDLEQAVADINGKTVGSSNSLEEVKTQTLEIGRRLKDQQTQLGQLRDQIYRLQQQIQQSNTPSPPVAAPAAGGVSTDQGKRP
jgi:predicted  nucleic acid-binding Zn-ribbon protein